MIPRYTRPEMAAIWEPQTRFRIWFEIEAHAADAMAELGIIPKEAAKTIWAKGKDVTFNVERIDEIERETKHDVIAFLTHLAEIVGPEARFVHQGMTSSDVLDTCFNLQLVRATDILIRDVDAVLAALKKRASGPTISARCVRKAMTSCLVSRSISSMRATSNVAALPLSQMVFAACFGMTPSSASASQACASISNQMRNLFSGDQTATISGRE